ncbi:MAG: hypothetical protein ACK55Z_17380, partial [bacterium]
YIYEHVLPNLKAMKSIQDKPLPEPYLRWIANSGKDPTCELMHPGMSCRKYAIVKPLSCLKHAMFLQIIGSLIPNILSNYSKLRSDPIPTLKLILKKYM